MKKTFKLFDCVEMKRRAQEQVYEETRGLSRREEVEYFHRAGEEFWKEMRSLRQRRKGRRRTKSGGR